MNNFWKEYEINVKKNCVLYTSLVMGFIVSRSLFVATGFFSADPDILPAITIHNFAIWSVTLVLIMPAISVYLTKLTVNNY